MTSFLPDAHFEQITVNAAHASEFEAFCQRNNIPFEAHSYGGNDATYLVRAGIDYMDAHIRVYKMGWHGEGENDFDVNNSLRYLIFSRNFWIPEYDYELSIHPRSKEDDINFQCVDS